MGAISSFPPFQRRRGRITQHHPSPASGVLKLARLVDDIYDQHLRHMLASMLPVPRASRLRQMMPSSHQYCQTKKYAEHAPVISTSKQLFALHFLTHNGGPAYVPTDSPSAPLLYSCVHEACCTNSRLRVAGNRSDLTAETRMLHPCEQTLSFLYSCLSGFIQNSSVLAAMLDAHLPGMPSVSIQ